MSSHLSLALWRAAALFHALAALAAPVSVSKAAEATLPPIELIRLGPAVGHLYRAAPPEARPHVGVIYENGTEPGPQICSAMAERGFLTLCLAEPGSIANQTWELVALDVKRAVEFMRRQPGIEHIVLYGHSGGGSVASFYQAVAENGVAFCQNPRKLTRCGDELDGLPKADAVIFPDAHPGTAAMNMRNLNPSLSLKNGKLVVDPALDPFNPANGYAPGGKARYSPEFQQRYFAAQALAMRGLIDEAHGRQSRIARGETVDPREDQILVPGLLRPARLEALDPTIPGLMSTQAPRKLLRNDGTISVELIRSTSVGETRGGRPAALQSLTRFLSRSASLGKDSLEGMDYCSSNSNTLCNVEVIRSPVLFMPMGSYIFIADQERMFERSPSTDKEFVVVEGALHSGAPCQACETTPGQFAHSQRNAYDYIAAWIRTRFPRAP